MKTLRLFNKSRNEEVLSKLFRTETLGEKMRGLIPFNRLEPLEGMYLPECTSIHTFFMRFPIDCYFLSQENKVLKIAKNLRSGRLSFGVWGTSHVLEVSSDRETPLKIDIGDILEIRETP